MYTVYVIYSQKYNKIYIGHTSNLEERLLSHNELASKGWTRKYRPWELILFEEYPDNSSAMERE